MTTPKELGITDLSELTAPLKSIKDADGEASFPLPKTGGGYQYYMYDQMGAGLYPMGVRYDDKDAKVVAVVEQDDVKQILKTSMSGTMKASSILMLLPARRMPTTRLAPSHRLVRVLPQPLGVRSAALRPLPRSGARPSSPTRLSAAR